jgi:hypothetical protein
MITITFERTEQSIRLTIKGMTEEAVKQYPASYKVRFINGSYGIDGKFHPENCAAHCEAVLIADQVNAGKNESGIKRLQKFIKKTREMDEVEFVEAEWMKICTVNAIHELPEEITR